MSKKKQFGLILFACLVMTGLFAGVNLMTREGSTANDNKQQIELTENDSQQVDVSEEIAEETKVNSLTDETIDLAKEEPWLSANPSDKESSLESTIVDERISDTDLNTQEATGIMDVTQDNSPDHTSQNIVEENSDNVNNEASASTDNTVEKVSDGVGGETSNLSSSEEEANSSEDSVKGNQDIEVSTNNNSEEVKEAIVEIIKPDLGLIYDCSTIDYLSYIPKELVYDSAIETALDISNPSLKITAKAAILIDADTMDVLYHKDAVTPVFPASTAKLLNVLVTLDWCKLDEEVTVGEEVKYIASDSSKALLVRGHVVTIKNLLEGMLLPSGNDAAYVAAAYVGRKSLKNEDATGEEAIKEFMRLMNEKAISLGATNSCFKTPDGYDAIGQYTTAYDMGMIGIAAAKNEIITNISKKSTSKNIFASGEMIRWKNSNSLVNKGSSRYYPYALGLKTGTTTMAGRCLVAAARKGDKTVVAVIMNSTSTGRYQDATKLLDFGLQ
ncbi:D-alanyl-D-alanine carboxypeptidase [Mobilitalea sibirica]|uniref:D-alanyl-D-alanine carboxypeptidase n=1 Tax=Mobilitalea sibirica TaxID=1462919 RepID=A0A8J7HD52_9FIRM|nr:D-alanyl-D-alanine carboxypeptidase [Mobilitalea sibirica]MBH1940444.1 D-alanyl-D-alanine carboxypeptidase [Mobilitalea sibirica]